MSDDRKERLEAIRRELEKQDEAWQRLQAVAARLGDVEIAVPRDVLEQLVGSNPQPAAPITGVRA
jgi:ferric-dicitrate binding protein FerR (iron transport regulator)